MNNVQSPLSWLRVYVRLYHSTTWWTVGALTIHLVIHIKVQREINQLVSLL